MLEATGRMGERKSCIIRPSILLNGTFCSTTTPSPDRTDQNAGTQNQGASWQPTESGNEVKG